MSIRYITEGDESRAKGLLGEGRHQLSILKNAMSFQNLQQLQRVVKFDDGTIIKCLSCFGQDVINIFVPVELVKKKRKIVEVFFCWCTDYFTLGRIVEILGDYGDVGDYGTEIYPDYCNFNNIAIKNYNGIRYKVSLCQGDRTTTYICLSSDFAEYKVDDKVIIFMRGIWKDTNLSEPVKRTPGRGCKNNEFVTCIACKGTRRKGYAGNEADGSYLIAPLGIAGVNA